MKTLLFVLMVLLMVTVSEAQITTVPNGQVAVDGIRGLTSGANWVGKSYADSQRDTSQSFNTRDWVHAYVTIKALDSIDVSLRYRPSYDGVTFYPEITVSSFTSAVNAGNVLSIKLPDGAMGCTAVQLVMVHNSSANGTSTATYSAKLIRKR
jgi:hypothetical protein